ncbi:MAG TPA: hypothetical protein VNR89_17465 [Roseomonas sp.]|nr:hypothetical protein [Roseomonas sp.]
MVKVYGTVTRLQPGGFGVVKVDGGKEGFFDRFGPLASQCGDRLKPGLRVQAEATSMDTDIVRLHSVAPADN